jgi:hypothetical protein
MKFIQYIRPILALLLLAGCAPPAGTAATEPAAMVIQTEAGPSPAATESLLPTRTSPPAPVEAGSPPPVPDTPLASALPSPTTRSGPRQLRPDEWKTLPIVPEISARAREIYRRGVQLGRDPQAFSKVGDCGSTPAWFLGDFDRGPKFYQLGEYTGLEPVIAHFQGSYGRTSLAAKAGFSASSLLTSLWANKKQCVANEIPLECEYRVHNPSFALITLGTNDVWHAKSFVPQMRKIIEFSIDNGILPILATKADNLEKDGSLNAAIAQLAIEYDVPLWNYWLAVQPLPDAGLQEDGAHITWGANRFDDPNTLQKGWTVRNLTALQVLDAVWRGVTEE